MSAVLSNDEKAARSATKRDDEPGVLAVPRRLSSVQIGGVRRNTTDSIGFRTPLRRCGYKIPTFDFRLVCAYLRQQTTPDATLRSTTQPT